MVQYLDANGSSWSFTYDDAGNWSGMTDPQGDTETRVYDSRGRMISHIDRNGRTFAYGYNSKNLVIFETVDTDPPTETSWTYDLWDRVEERS